MINVVAIQAQTLTNGMRIVPWSIAGDALPMVVASAVSHDGSTQVSAVDDGRIVRFGCPDQALITVMTEDIPFVLAVHQMPAI